MKIISYFFHIRRWWTKKYKNVLSSPVNEKWKIALEDEIKSIHDNKILTLVDLSRRKTIGNK